MSIPEDITDDFFVICPYCKHKLGEGWDSSLSANSEPEQCPECKKDFLVWEEVSTVYVSSPSEKHAVTQEALPA